MKTNLSALAGLLLLPAAGLLAQVTTPTVPHDLDRYDHESWVDPFFVYSAYQGDVGAYHARLGIPDELNGGIEDFRYTAAGSGDGVLTLEGHAKVDMFDYRLVLNYEVAEKWSFQAGYKEFRTWYDGSSVYLPVSRSWISIYPENFGADRSEFWATGTLNVGDSGLLTLKYRHLERDGWKNNLHWGSATIPVYGSRNIVPAYTALDESRDIISLDYAQDGESTDFDLGLTWESIQTEDSKNVRRNPFESTDRYLSQQDFIDIDVFTAHGSATHTFNANASGSVGALYTTLDRNTTGYRTFGNAFNSAFDPAFVRQDRDEGYYNLHMDGQIDQFVLNAAFNYKLRQDLSLTASARFEDLTEDAIAEFIETNYLRSSGGNIEEELENEKARDWNSTAGTLELRYTGIEKVVLAAELFGSMGDGNLDETEIDVHTSTIGIARDTDHSRDELVYSFNAKWYPLPAVSLAAEYYHQDRYNDWDDLTDSTTDAGSDAYPAYLKKQDYKTDDFNVRLTWRPLKGFTSVTRYDWQVVEILTTPGANLPGLVSAEFNTDIFSQSLTYAPSHWVYFSGSVNLVSDAITTPAALATGTPSREVLNVGNDYDTYSLSVGLTPADSIDFVADYFYYMADNFIDNSDKSIPAGASIEEHGFNLGVSWHQSANVVYTLNYRYYTSDDNASGGLNDFDADMVYGKAQIRF